MHRLYNLSYNTLHNFNGIEVSEIYRVSLLIASEILSIENGERKRTAEAQKHFEHAIECLLKDLWLGTAIFQAGLVLGVLAFGCSYSAITHFLLE